MSRISLIIPTYNEAKNVPLLLEEVAEHLRNEDVEYIIVDDNSPDKTAMVVKELMKKYPIHLIERPGKAGLGSAVRAGFAVAKGDLVGVMDADLSHDPSILPQMIAALRAGGDIAIGSRFGETSKVESWAWWRRMTSECGVWAARKLTRTEDPLSGFFLMKKEVIANTVLTTTGYKILLEILVKGSYQTVKEFPFTFRMRKHSVSKLNSKEYFLFACQVVRYTAQRIWTNHRVFLGFLSFGLLVIGLALRQSVWLDEGLSWSFAQDSVREIVYRSIHTDLHPPLYYIFLHTLLFIFPPSVTILRGVSVMAFILFTLLLYARVRTLYPEKKSWVLNSALGLVALSPFVLYYAGELRSSMVVILLTLIQWMCFERFLASPKERRSVLSFLLISIILLYTFYPILFVLVGQLVYALWRRIDTKALLLSVGTLFLLYVPWVYVLAEARLHEDAAHFLTIPWWQIPAIVVLGFLGGRVGITDMNHLHWYWPTAVIGLAAIGVGAVLFMACRYAWKQVQPLVFVSGIAFALALVVSATKVSLFDPRYHATLYPLLALTLIHGCVALLERSKKAGSWIIGAVGVAYSITLALYLFHPLFGREPWRQAVEALGAKTEPQDVVIFYGLEGVEPPPSFRVYQTAPIEVSAIYPHQRISGNTDPEVLSHVEDIIERHERVWLTQFLAWQKDPEEVIRNVVASRCTKTDSVGYFKVIFDLYECPKR